MRKLFSAIMILVLLTSGAASAARPISTRSTSVHAPVPPTPPAVSAEERSPSTEAGAIDQNFPTPPVPGELAPEMEEARARKAIEAMLQKRLDYWGPRYQTAPVEVEVAGDWAYGVAEWESVDQMTDGPIHVLARRDESGAWQALLPSEEGLFPQWLKELSPTVVFDAESKKFLRQTNLGLTLPGNQDSPQQDHQDCTFGVENFCDRPLSAIPTNSQDIKFENLTQVSPDGKYVAYVTAENFGMANSSIWISSIESSHKIRVVQSNEDHWVTNPVWSPDSQSIAYLKVVRTDYEDREVNYRFEIWSTKIDGTDNTLLIRDPKLHPVLGFGGEADIVWTTQNEIEFNDAGEIHKARYAYDVEHKTVHRIGKIKQESTFSILSQPSNVPFFRQCDSSWGGDPLGTCSGLTICSDGCYVASAAMVFNYFGVNTNPGILNSWLTNNGGYDQGCLLNGWQAVNYHSNIHSFVRIDGEDWNRLNSELDSGYPVIARVSNAYGYHFVVVTHRDGNTYYLNDPLASAAGARTLDDYNNSFSGLRIFHGELSGGEECSAPSLNAPNDGYVSPNRSIDFSWSPPSDCTPDGYTFRVKTVPDMDSGGTTLFDEGQGVTQVSKSFGSEWDNTDLYWSVRACKPCTPYNPGPWAPSHRFRIEPGSSGGEVRLYDHTNYGGDYVYVSSPGLYTVVDNFNDRAESIQMPDYWSVRLFRHADYYGPEICIRNNDSDLGNDYFSDGHVVANETTWFEVYDQSDCPPVITPPSAPSLQSPSNGATFDEGQGITLSWSDTGNEYYGEISGGPAGTTTFGWQSGTSNNIGSQWAGYTYSWRVKARNAAGESSWSSTRTFTVKPAAPSNLSATAVSCNEIELQWSDNSGNEEGYKIYRNGSYVNQVGANVTSYNDVGISEASSYSYYVRAFRGDIRSDQSNTASASTPPCPTIGPLVYDDHTIDDDNYGQSEGNDDGIVDCGETIELYVDLRNEGNTTASNVSASISTNDSHVTWPYNTSSNYGDIPSGAVSTNSDDFDFHIDQLTPDGHVITFNMIATDDNGDTWSDTFNVPVSCSIPDLKPYAPSGYQYPVVPSSIPDTTQSDTLLAGNFPTYFDWHFTNAGWGDAPGTFYVELWIDDERHIRYPFGTFGPGWVSGFNDWMINVEEPGWHTVRLITDPDDTVEELDEDNNVWEREFYWESTCGDPYELNNVYTDATTLSYGESKSAHICPAGDVDFYQFTGVAGDKVVIKIEAQNEGSALDSYIYLLDGDGSTVLAQNDDARSGVLDSILSYELSHDGIYYIKVRDYDHPYVGGDNHFYTIHLLTDHTDPASVEITSPATNDWMGDEITVTVSAIDDESGVNRVEFLWHNADWENSDWVWLGADYNGDEDNGWRWPFDASAEDEQRGGTFYVWAFDWAGNWTDAGSWNLGIDRTPPTVTPSVEPVYGDAPFRDFWVRWWDSYDNLSGIDNYDVQYRDGATGAWTNLAISTTQVYTSFVGEDDHTYYFRARARDHAGNLGDYSTEEVSHTVDICDVAADAYESDNTVSSASWITPDGYAQIHNVHTEEDVDWVKFEAQAGVTYTLSTGNTGGHADTVLELYDTDGSTLLAENDDCLGRWPASCLDWQAHADGVYYAKVYHWDPWAYGCTTEYGLSIVSNRAPALELGEPGTSFRYTDTFGVTETAYPSDTAHLNGPNGLFIDDSDNLYLAEELGARILKYHTSDGANLLSIGTAGFQDRGAYTFNHPRDVAVDSNGDIWTIDRHRVAQYDASGNFLQEFPPDDPWNAGDDDAHFDTPRGIAFDSSGRMYVSDSNNHRIQVYIFDVEGTPVYSTTVGVTGQPGDDDAHFNRPAQIVINSSDRLYVADVNNYRVQRCYYNDGWTCYTIHGTGSAGDGSDELNLAYGLGINDAGEIYIADSANGRVKECYAHMFGWTCNTFVDGLEWPAGVAVDSDAHVYVSDGSDHTIREYDSDGNVQGVLAGTSGVPYLTDDHHFNKPADVAVDGDGNRFVVEEAGQRLLKLGPNGNALAVVGTPGVTGDDDAHLNWAQGVAVSADGTVYLADTWNHRVQIFDNDLNYQTTLGTGICGSADAFCGPHNVALDASGRLYVADTWNHRVQVFDSSYNLVATLGVTGQTGQDNLHFHTPRGVAVDTEGFIYVAEETNKRVQKCVLVGESGSCTTFAGVTGVDGDDFAHLRAPLDVAVDAQNRIYVNDSWWNQRVQVFDSSGAGSGVYLTTIGGAWGGQHGRFRHPNGIGIAPDGAVYVADADNMRIEQYALGVPDWTQVNVNGFGDPKTAGVSVLAEFGGYLYAGASNWESDHAQIWRTTDETTWENVTPASLTSNALLELSAYDGHLYAGTGWGGGTGQIWRSSDGITWSAVMTDGFGDSDNEAVTKLTAFEGYLYAVVQNNVDGFSVWRSATGDAGSWEAVVTDGHGSPNPYIVTGLTVFNGQLYAACENEADGAEIWRSGDGSTWEQVASGGFDDPNNTHTGGFAVFDGQLYIGTRNNTTGAQLWRSSDGATWSSVITDGFGDHDNQKLESLHVAYDALYAVIYNDTGAQVWRSDDGSTWDAVRTDGWGDANNYATLWSNATLMFNGHLHVGTWNDAHGGELWRSNLQLARADFSANPTQGIAPLAVEFTNLATGDYDTCTWDFGDGGVSSNCDDPTHTYDPDADALGSGAGHAYTVTLTVAGAGGRATETKRSYITAVGLYKVYLPLTIRNWPPVPGTPVLNAITAPDDSATYQVSWSAADRADTYILEEATRSDFTDTEEIYSDQGTSHTVDSEGVARYYYRVKARNSWGDSGWSNAQSVEVRWEKEPNNNAKTQANGPLVSGSTYYGLLPADDVQDYFYFDLSAAGFVELWLTNIAAGQDYDVYLRDVNLDEMGKSAQAGNVDEHIVTGVLPPGRYYIQVHNYGASGSSQPYHLRVVYE